jgi:CheY-like chemotaxis protein
MLLQARAREKQLAFSVTLDQRMPPRLTTDPTRLRQILVNLLDNAVKFTPAGSVSLHVRRSFGQRAGWGEYLCFDVVDTGIGITAEQFARLFEPFVQADTSTTRQYGGTGLGLAISRHLARLLGGDIEARSTPGQGSQFTLWIPLDAGPDKSHGDSAPAGPTLAAAPLTARILVVEDSPDMQMLLEHILTRAGATVQIAADGHEGLERAMAAFRQNAPFDLILMDLQMPGMDGCAVTRALRAQSIQTPIIALTAAAMDTNVRESAAAGCDGFLCKPIDPESLRALVRRWTHKPMRTAPASASPAAQGV